MAMIGLLSFQNFSHLDVFESIFDLGVKQVRVNIGSLLDPTSQGHRLYGSW